MMICKRCGRRFGEIGVDFWNARSGICPYCEGTQNPASFFITADLKKETD